MRELQPELYEIIAGERRWRAAMLANLVEIPCMVGIYSDEQAATLTLIENIQRQDLNLIEEANGYYRLHHEFNYQQNEIACLVGKSRSHIANIMRLLSLSDKVQTRLIHGKLTLGHARMLVSLPHHQQSQLAERIEQHEWSVRQLEQQIRALKATILVPSDPKKDRDVAYLQNKLAEQIGAPVEICNENGTGGWLKVKFFDNDTLAGLLERMGLRYD